MSARTNAREAAHRACRIPEPARVLSVTECADAALDSVLASLDTPEMREAVALALHETRFSSDDRGEHAVLAAVRAELTRET